MKQDPFSGYRALSPKELAEMLMNPNAPKTEAEHWAVREIEKQRAEIERLRAEVQRQTRHVEQLYDQIRRRADERDKAQIEVERLREALEGKP